MGKLTHTVKGPIASFRSADKSNIESLKFHFLPKQEGSGDPSPTNIRPITGWTGLNGRRAGKNLIDINSDLTLTGTEKVNNTFVNTITDTRDEVQIYFIGYKKVGNNFTLLGNFKIIGGITSARHIVVNFTVSSDFKEMTHFCIKHNGKTHDFRVYFPLKLPVGATLCCSLDVLSVDVTTIGGFSMGNIQLEVGSVEGTYEPYSGSAFPVTFPVYTKNLFNPRCLMITNQSKFSLNGDKITQTGSDDREWTDDNRFPPINLPAGTYTLSCSDGNAINFMTSADGYTAATRFGDGVGTFTIGENIGIKFKHSASSYPVTFTIQIESGNQATDYVPFLYGGTWFGGYYDPVAGEMVYSWRKFKVKDYEWTYKPGNHRFQTQLSSGERANASGSWTNFAISDSYKQSDQQGYQNLMVATYSDYYVYIRDDSYESADDFVEARGEVEIAYELKDHIRIPISPQNLQAFLDHNNFWSDANGDTEVEYCFADRLSEQKLIMDTPHIASVSGSVASFDTDIKAPIVDLKAHFTPVQEGSGDPSPSNVRSIHGLTGLSLFETGANLFNVNVPEKDPDNISYSNSSKRIFTPFTYCKGASYSNYFNKENVTTYEKSGNGFQLLSRAGYGVGFAFPLKSGITYRCNFTKTNGGIVDVAFYAKDGTYLGYQNSVENTAVTVPSDAEISVFVFRSTSADTTVTLTNLYLCKNGDMSSYEDHNNELVFPIEFPATKNLLDATKVSRNIGGATFSYSEGTWKFENCGTGNSSAVWGSQIFPAGTYTIKATCDREGVRGYRLLCSSSSCGGQWLDWYGGYFIDSSNGTDKITFTTTEEFSVGLCFLNNSQHPSSPGTLKDIQLERGSTATVYEPYGTIYGGYVDLIRGKVIATYCEGIIKKAVGKQGNFFYTTLYSLNKPSIKSLNAGLRVDRFPNNPNTSEVVVNQAITFYNNGIIRWIDEDYISYSLADYNAYLSEHPFQYVYELATPIEYDITPQILKTLKGTNNIWSDTNGNAEVSYWTH